MPMRLKKRHKSSRWRGSSTHGRGFKKKARGSGHQGGVGLAGTGKRGDQKKTMILSLFGNDYFGKDKTLRRGHVAPKSPVINLGYIAEHIDNMIKQGTAKKSKDGYEITLSEYKVLGDGDIKEKITLKAKSVSASAKEKIEAAGGKIEVSAPQKE